MSDKGITCRGCGIAAVVSIDCFTLGCHCRGWDADAVITYADDTPTERLRAEAHMLRDKEALLPTDDERRAMHWFLEGNDSIRECSAVMDALRRMALKP